jgi:hypothetical protein
MGAMRTRVAVYILFGAALLGVIGTVVTGSEPGVLLGFLVLVGAVIAVLGIQRKTIYVIFPLPALAIFLGAVVTGAIHDSGIDTSKTQLGLSFLQWIANVFFVMCATTILVLVIAGGRWLLSMQLVSGQFPMSGTGRGGSRGPRTPASGRRPERAQRPGADRDPWGTVDPWNDRAGPGDQWANRDERDSRDSRGDRRPAGPTQPPSGNQPGGAPPPGGRNQPGDTAQPSGRNQPGGTAQPGDRNPPGGGSRPGGRAQPPDRVPRDPWDDQNPRGTRSQRTTRDQRDPRDPWSQR